MLHAAARTNRSETWALVLSLLCSSVFAGCASAPKSGDNPYGSSDASPETFWESCKVVEDGDTPLVNCGDVVLMLVPTHVDDLASYAPSLVDSAESSEDLVDLADELGGEVRHAYFVTVESENPRQMWFMELSSRPGVVGVCLEALTNSSSCREVLPMVLSDLERAESVGLRGPVGSANRFAELDIPEVATAKAAETMELGLGESPIQPVANWYIAYEGDVATHRCEVQDGGFDCEQLGETERLGSAWFQAGLRPVGDTKPFPFRGADLLEPGLIPGSSGVVSIGRNAVWFNGEKVAAVEQGRVPPEQKKGGKTGLKIRKLTSTADGTDGVHIVLFVDRSIPYLLVTEVLYSLGQASKSSHVFAQLGSTERLSLRCEKSTTGLSCDRTPDGTTAVEVSDIRVRRMSWPILTISTCEARPRDALSTIRKISGLRGCYLAELERNPDAAGALDVGVQFGPAIGPPLWGSRAKVEKSGNLSREFVTCVESNAAVPESPEILSFCSGKFRVNFTPADPSVNVDADTVRFYPDRSSRDKYKVGRPDVKATEAVLSRARSQYAACMTRNDAKDVVLEIQIGPNGAPLSTFLTPKKENETAFGKCMRETTMKIQFPKPIGGGLAIIRVPFETGQK